MGYIFIAMTVLLTVYGQLVLKWQVDIAGPLPDGITGKLVFLAHALLNPWVISGLGAAFVAALCWMLALSKLPISTAYPFTAAAFVLIVFGGAWLFAEPLSTMKLIGVGLIVAGVVLMGFE